MDKIAQLKHAEVAGVISGLIDGGYIKLASEQEFEDLTGIVAGSISDNWDLNEVLDKTAEVMSGEEDMDKTAEEALAEFGALCLVKQAGLISDEDFYKEAAKVKIPTKATEIIAEHLAGLNNGAGAVLQNLPVRASAAWKTLKDTLSLADARALRGNIKALKGAEAFHGPEAAAWETPGIKDLLKSLKNPAKLYGGAVGTGAGLYGLKKDNRDAIAAKFKAGKKAILG